MFGVECGQSYGELAHFFNPREEDLVWGIKLSSIRLFLVGGGID